GGDLVGRCLFVGFQWWGDDLVWVGFGQAAVAGVDQGSRLGKASRRSSMPSVRTAVWSCCRPGRIAPAQRGRPRASEATVALIVFCFFLPETYARRPGRLAGGRRTWISVPSRRMVRPSAAA